MKNHNFLLERTPIPGVGSVRGEENHKTIWGSGGEGHNGAKSEDREARERGGFRIRGACETICNGDGGGRDACFVLSPLPSHISLSNKSEISKRSHFPVVLSRHFQPVPNTRAPPPFFSPQKKCLRRRRVGSGRLTHMKEETRDTVYAIEAFTTLLIATRPPFQRRLITRRRACPT